MKIQINSDKLKHHRKVINVLTNKTTLRIMKLLAETKGCNVTSIYTQLKLEQTVVSIYLKALKNVNFVNSVRKGKSKFYSLNEPVIERYLNLINS